MRNRHFATAQLGQPVLKLRDVEITSNVVSKDLSFLDEHFNELYRVLGAEDPFLSFRHAQILVRLNSNLCSTGGR